MYARNIARDEVAIKASPPSDEFHIAIPNFVAAGLSRFMDSAFVEIIKINSAEFVGHTPETVQVFLASMICAKVLFAVTTSTKNHKGHRHQSLNILLPESLPVLCQSNQEVGR
jgi:hypothetical protein